MNAPRKVRRKRGPERQNAVETRKKLMNAGRRAFSRKGLGGTSLREDILATAGISAGSFYHQFDDKEHLLVAILEHDGEELFRQLDAFRDSPESRRAEPIERAKMAMELIFDLTDKGPDFMKIYVREYHSDSAAVRRVIRALNERTIEHNRRYYQELSEELGVRLESDTLAVLATVLTFAVTHHYLDVPKRQRSELRRRLVDGVVDLFAGGVARVKT